jgi:phytoene synthase
MNDDTSLAAVDETAHVEAVVKRSGTSFYWAMRWLPEKKRQAMYGIYAFCREVDDIADGDGPLAEKKNQLGQWCGEIERLYGDQPRNPVTRALQGPIEDFGLKKEDFRAIIDGMEMDACDRVRIADMDELNLYCDRVACAAGRLCVRVFGVGDGEGRELAFALGQALQLTNILRDISEDAERDRLYIPGDLLRAHDVAATDLSSVLRSPSFTKACEVLADVAARRFAEAEKVISRCEREKVRPALMMMEVYRRILDKLMWRGWRHLNLPVDISKPRKLWIALRYGLFS